MAEVVSKVPAAGFCAAVTREDAIAGGLCELLVSRGETLASLDTGLSGKLYRAPQDASARPDGRVQVQEVFARAIEVMEGELFPLGEISPQQEQQLFSYKAWQLGFRVPWLLYDGDAATRTDIEVRLQLQAKVAAIRADAVRRAGGDAVERDRLIVGELFAWVQETLPRSATGLERNLLGAMRSGAGDCTENSMLLYLSMRLAGLDAGIAFVHEDARGERVFHLSASAMIDGVRQLVDPIPPYTSIAAAHRNAVGLPLLSVMLVHHWNRYFNQEQGREQPLAPATDWTLYDPTMLTPR